MCTGGVFMLGKLSGTVRGNRFSYSAYQTIACSFKTKGKLIATNNPV